MASMKLCDIGVHSFRLRDSGISSFNTYIDEGVDDLSEVRLIELRRNLCDGAVQLGSLWRNFVVGTKANKDTRSVTRITKQNNEQITNAHKPLLLIQISI